MYLIPVSWVEIHWELVPWPLSASLSPRVLAIISMLMTYDYVNINVVCLQWMSERSTSNGSLKTLYSHKTGISMHVATQHNKHHLMWCATILALCVFFCVFDTRHEQQTEIIGRWCIHDTWRTKHSFFFCFCCCCWRGFFRMFFRTFMFFFCVFHFRCFSSPELNWVMFRSAFQTNWVSFTCVFLMMHCMFFLLVGSFRSKSSQH